MVQNLEDTTGVGGSIRVGATGTIGSLMTREMESTKTEVEDLVSLKNKSITIPVSVPCNAFTPKGLQPKTPLDEASSSGGSTNSSFNHKSPEIGQKPKSYHRKTHRVPILSSDHNIALDRTPTRGKRDKKVTKLVEIVDIKCGIPDKARARPITNRLKKLGFSKLSESIV